MGIPNNLPSKTMKLLFFLLTFVIASYAEEELLSFDSAQLDQRGLATLMMRELLVPFNSINQLADWINQVPRSVFLDCPTDEVAFGLVCDPNQISRQDLDNYFCGSSPDTKGWCGAFWAVTPPEAKRITKRGVSNGAVSVSDLPAEYDEMFRRICGCHCGCLAGGSEVDPNPQKACVFNEYNDPLNRPCLHLDGAFASFYADDTPGNPSLTVVAGTGSENCIQWDFVDVYCGIFSDVFLYGGPGNNYMDASAAQNLNAHIYGEAGNDNIYGGNLLNFMNGGEGDDQLTQGPGPTLMDGGPGANNCQSCGGSCWGINPTC